MKPAALPPQRPLEGPAAKTKLTKKTNTDTTKTAKKLTNQQKTPQGPRAPRARARARGSARESVRTPVREDARTRVSTPGGEVEQLAQGTTRLSGAFVVAKTLAIEVI